MPRRNQARNGQRGRSRRNGTVRGRLSGRRNPRNGQPTESANRSNPVMSVRNMPLFPARTRRTVQYFTRAVPLSGTGSAGAYVFSANGLNDPDITGTGGQPMGFDQMMIYYNHYTVVRSRITAMVIATSAAAPVVGLVVSGSATPLTSVEQLVENGRCTMAWLEATGIANSKCTLRAAVNLGKYQGLKNVIDDPDMRGDASTNPTEQVYFLLYVWNGVDNTAVGASAQLLIEYDTIFHEAKSASLS